MKERLFLLVVIFIAVPLIFISCGQAGSEDNVESNVSSLKFIPLSQRLSAQTRGSNMSIIICSWDWGRPHHSCKGFGFCNFQWFPDFNEAKVPSDELEYNSSLIEKDSEGNLYTDLMLADSIDSTMQNQLPNLEIEEALSSSDTINHVVKIMTVKPGSIKFTPKVGPHGGYRVHICKDSLKVEE